MPYGSLSASTVVADFVSIRTEDIRAELKIVAIGSNVLDRREHDTSAVEQDIQSCLFSEVVVVSMR